MNPNDEIESLEEIIDQILRGLQDVMQSGEILTDEFQGMVAQELTWATSRLDQLRSQAPQEPTQPPEEPLRPQAPQQPPSPGAQLMWILAGQREDVFLQYLQTYPDPELQALLRNPTELERVVQFLHEMMPSGRPEVSPEGIPHAELNSSNVYGFQYDPSSKKLLVKFQGTGGSGEGPIYQYNGVPLQVYRAFENGAIPAKTSGQNRWGRWWQGKIPSLGAAFHQLIRQGGYNYQQVG